ncbi:MAG: hypothetical protein F6K18_10730 [Okeania sp. SIO2C2]|uniref:hypothetical protein n=1 Tax=Okeania sp. SIO2C2 TaxID=2607787 RepID=UPI0013BD0B2C|nr:hypothetical protein [Okeania sp. SIO2C2]NEP87263.1 hypothetical protein [Okeania sp. SIO2C2]
MLKKYFSRGRRQETAILETGEMDRERGSRSGRFVRMIFRPNYAPKIRSMHEREELKQAQFFRSQKGTCLYMSMLLYLISKP